jgi:hypothetical protein
MAKGNNTAENTNRGRLTVKCPAKSCNKDMELVKVKGQATNGMFLVCPSCGNRMKYTKGLYKNYDHYIKL